jgi:hypothetical protein
MRWKKQALTGRAAWGVLGSAAGGHVCYWRNETRRPGRSFAENCGNVSTGCSAQSSWISTPNSRKLE